MSKRVLMAILMLCALTASGQADSTYFRSGIFLHHSTGGCIWGPNGSPTSVPAQVLLYNQEHGYTGDMAVSMSEQWFPGSSDNEWSTWHTIFEQDEPEAISTFYAGDRIIMIKSCFPSSSLEGVGQPSDSTSPWMKTVCNYKWHWRHMAKVMRAHPQNFFVIWTNAPLERASTEAEAAHLSARFCTWAADTLALGLDPVFGALPPNVGVFDFFHLLTDGEGVMRDEYRNGPGDSHPNAAATALVAPLLVRQVFDSAIAYETFYNDPEGPSGLGEAAGPAGRLSVGPSPSTGPVHIRYTLLWEGPASVSIYAADGRLLRVLPLDRPDSGTHQVEWDGKDADGRVVPSGVQLCRLITGTSAVTTRFVRVR